MRFAGTAAAPTVSTKEMLVEAHITSDLSNSLQIILIL